MGEISAISIKNVSNSWIGAGVVYDLNRKWQLAGMLGIAANKGGSGVDVGIGINYLF